MSCYINLSINTQIIGKLCVFESCDGIWLDGRAKFLSVVFNDSFFNYISLLPIWRDGTQSQQFFKTPRIIS